MGDDVVEGRFLPRAQRQGQLAVEVGRFRSEERGGDRRDGDGRPPRSQPPERDGPLLADFRVRAHALEGQDIQRRQDLRLAHGTSRGNQAEEGLYGFRESLRLLHALDHHQKRALGRLPQQRDVHRLGGCGEARETQPGGLIGLEAAQQSLKGRMARQAEE